MGERALRWGLRLLEITLIIGPILAAFAAYGWDYKAVVMPSPNPLEKLRFETPHAGPVGTPTKMNEYMWETTVSFTSPFDFAFTIENYSGEIYCVQAGDNVRLGSLRLKQEVEFQPRTTENITVIMEFTSSGRAHLEGHGLGASVEVEFRNIIVEIGLFGISVTSPPTTQRTAIQVS